MSYPVVRTDNLAGTKDPAKLRSICFYNGATATAIPNGSVVKLDSIAAASDREVWKGVACAANTPKSQVALIATPELMYDERLKNLDDFTNEAGSIARGYILEAGDIFSVTNDGVSTSLSTIAAGNVVELAAGTQLKIVASATSGSTTIGRVVGTEVVGKKTYVVIEVA